MRRVGIGVAVLLMLGGLLGAPLWAASPQEPEVVCSNIAPFVFSEQGSYTTPHGRVLTMHNRFWWQRSERGIRLSHLRYEAPVELFELQPQGDGRWLTAEPHLCGADHYSAELTEIDGGFLLSWQISGPRKNERLSYRYLI